MQMHSTQYKLLFGKLNTFAFPPAAIMHYFVLANQKQTNKQKL